MKRGKFITLEGGEGVGKTTNIDYIKNYLREAGIDVVVTREPGGTALGEKIRALLLGHEIISIEAELLLIFAARAQHLQEVIVPALEAGRWVVCDRFTEASYAYQGGGRGIEEARIRYLEQWLQGSLRPDLTLLLDVPVEVGLERLVSRSDHDRFEKERIEFFQRVRSAYLDLSRRFAQRIKVIDAGLPLPEVQQQITQYLLSLLE